MTRPARLRCATPKKTSLADAEWREVFRIRCSGKQGRHVSEEDLDLCTRAFKMDKKRYLEMEADVFDATVPFGSAAKARRR
jgi:hypothetical protein